MAITATVLRLRSKQLTPIYSTFFATDALFIQFTSYQNNNGLVLLDGNIIKKLKKLDVLRGRLSGSHKERWLGNTLGLDVLRAADER